MNIDNLLRTIPSTLLVKYCYAVVLIWLFIIIVIIKFKSCKINKKLIKFKKS